MLFRTDGPWAMGHGRGVVGEEEYHVGVWLQRGWRCGGLKTEDVRDGCGRMMGRKVTKWD